MVLHRIAATNLTLSEFWIIVNFGCPAEFITQGTTLRKVKLERERTHRRSPLALQWLSCAGYILDCSCENMCCGLTQTSDPRDFPPIATRIDQTVPTGVKMNMIEWCAAYLLDGLGI